MDGLKCSKLRKTQEFDRCFNKGRRFYTRSFIIVALYRRDSEFNLARLGIAISRKVAKAVYRNRVKRLLREFFRKKCEKMNFCFDVVIAAKRHLNARKLNLADVTSELDVHFENLAKYHSSS